MRILFFIIVYSLFFNFSGFSQNISFGGQFGWASPVGGSFLDSNDEKMAKGGLNFDGDVLYHFSKYDNKLAAGVTVNKSILFGSSASEGIELGMYSLELYGIKGSYRFFNTAVSPYANLSFGLSRLATPEIKINDEVVAESEKAFSLGLRPEIGIYLGKLTLSVGYIVPMKYSITDETAGSWHFNLGFRYPFNFDLY